MSINQSQNKSEKHTNVIGVSVKILALILCTMSESPDMQTFVTRAVRGPRCMPGTGFDLEEVTVAIMVGSQRALEFAKRADVYDRALWTRTAAATNAAGASTALVGSPETVAAAILDYIDLGASLVSIRGYDTLTDVAD